MGYLTAILKAFGNDFSFFLLFRMRGVGTSRYWNKLEHLDLEKHQPYTVYLYTFRFYLGSLPLKFELPKPAMEYIGDVKIIQNPAGDAPKYKYGRL